MVTGLLGERVRRDVEVVARAGLDVETFAEEAIASTGRALRFDAACLATTDPGTGLLTGARKYGGLVGRNEHDHEFGLIEYGQDDPTAFTVLADQHVAAAGVHLQTRGDVSASVRMDQFMRPHFGFRDELRMVFTDERGMLWGGLALFREEDRPFDPDEVRFAASLSGVFALGMRAGLLSAMAAHRPTAPGGPAVLVVDASDRVVRTSVGAEAWLDELVQGPVSGAPIAPVASLVGAARRFASGRTSVVPRSRVRSASGLWLVMHASPLAGPDGVSGEVVVTIEEARPPEIVPLVVAAFGLTPRERDVTQLVLQGLGTREIAAAVHLSAYTVQDHLKSVFEKAAVRSRRELVARIYFDQYVPRMGAELGPSGWFDPAG
jgi:DNA-binding CsgD family transcriptional regulator